MVSLAEGTRANSRTHLHTVLMYDCIFRLWLLLFGRPVKKKLSWMANSKRACHIPNVSNLCVCTLLTMGFKTTVTK